MDLATPRVHEVGKELHVTYGSDSGLYVEFHMEAEHQAYASEEAGYPVYKDIPFVTIMFPGDNTKKVVRPVDLKGKGDIPPDDLRFQRQWASFQNQSTQVQDGLPITEWPPITKSVAMSLKGMNVHTVQQLASIGDNALTWLGARELREKAKAYLSAATDGAAVLKMQTENENLRKDIASLKKQFAEMANERKSSSK